MSYRSVRAFSTIEDLSVTDDLTVADDATITGDLIVTGTTNSTGNAVFGNVNVTGSLVCDLGNVDAPKSFCTIYKTSLDVISTTLGTTPAAVTGTFGTEHKSADFTVTALGGRITYTGASTRKFLVKGYMVMGSSNPRTVITKLSKDGGSTFTNSQAGASISAGFEFAYPVFSYISLAQNEYFEVFAAVTSSTSNVYTTHTVLTIQEYPVAR